MHSKALTQRLRLNLDTMGMSGPVTRRDVAEKTLRLAPDKDWAQADLFDAKLNYLIVGVAELMAETHTQAFVDKHLPDSMPDSVRNALAACPRFICISKRGGRAAQHVLAIKATQQQWADYIDLKRYIEGKVRSARLADQNILDLLRMLGAKTIEDLFK